MNEYIGELPNFTRIYCNSCGKQTNHEVKSSHSFIEEISFDGHIAGWDETVTRFLLCLGCNTALIENCFTSNGFVRPADKQIYSVKYVPPRIKGTIAAKKFIQLPDSLDRIYQETITTFNVGANVLCAIGLRALIEGICADRNFLGNNLAQKIDSMSPTLPENIVASLHGFRFMGNTAAHELTAPDRSDLKLAIEIAEDLLNYLYDLDYKATQLIQRRS